MNINYNLIAFQKLFRFLMVSVSALGVQGKQEKDQLVKIKKMFRKILNYKEIEDIPYFDYIRS